MTGDGVQRGSGSSAAPRVLVVDDSAFARKVLRDVLQADGGIGVVEIARDGLEALEKIETFRPDVVTLDLVMPNLDGLGVLRELATRPPGTTPVVLVVSFSDSESELGVEALQTGAFDLIHKPTALATVRMYDLGAELLRKVHAAARAAAAGTARRAGGTPLPGASPRDEGAAAAATLTRASTVWPAATPGGPRLLVIGTSTGGPQALTRLLPRLPVDLPVPVVAAVHIPFGYTRSMAERLDRASALSVIEADADRTPLEAGRVVIARGGAHLLIERDGPGRLAAAVVHEQARPAFYVPSIDRLFASAAAATDGHMVAVVLTGMGNDGLAGARAVRGAGGVVLTEDESSCVVYGMPREVWEANLSQGRAPLDDLPTLLLRHLVRS